MRYFEKQAKDTKKEVSFGTRMKKHPVATVLMGPAAAYGASDENLGQSNLGKAVGVSALIGGSGSIGAQGARELLARHSLKGTGISMDMVNNFISRGGRGGFSSQLMGSTPGRLAIAGALGLGISTATAPVVYWLGKKLGKTRPKNDYKEK